MKSTERILPTYEMIEVSKIEVPNYQRNTNSRVVKQIVKNFKSAKLGVLIVSLRDGKYYIVDGLHRLTALRMMGHDFVMCEVHRKLSYEDEAELFYTQGNNRINLTAGDIFIGKLEAKDEKAMSIEKTVKLNGFAVIRKGGKAKYTIAAISMIYQIEKLFGLEHLDKTLSVIKNTWDGMAASTDAKILMGVALFLNNNGVEIPKFIKRLSRIDPVVIIREGNSDISNKENKRFEAVIANYYNKNTSKNRISI